jgi:hypothetical protein
MMGINGQVGETAGKVWHTLSSDGPQTISQLEQKLVEPNDALLLAVGWLAREEKVEISREKTNLRVRLK